MHWRAKRRKCTYACANCVRMVVLEPVLVLVLVRWYTVQEARARLCLLARRCCSKRLSTPTLCE